MINHTTLLNKLELYNFGQEALQWTNSYLENRSQYVNIGTRNSRYSTIHRGVPQGSVLGPILYILYINELPAITNDAGTCTNQVHKIREKLFTDNCETCGIIPTYADDSTMVIMTDNRFEAQEKLNRNMEKNKKYMDANELSMNMGKTEIVQCMVRQKRTRIGGAPPQITVQKPDGTLKQITAAISCRLLGTNINQDITWKHHLEQGERALLPALRSQIGMLTHIGQNIPMRSKLLLANGLIVSKVTYLIQMWGGLNLRDTKKIQVLLNKCARVITGAPRKMRTRDLMVKCGWLYFAELVNLHSLLMLWKILHMRKPYYLAKTIYLDQNNLAITSVPRLQMTRQSFKWRSAQEWNMLNADLRGEKNLIKFKRNLKKYIVQIRPPVVQRVRPLNWEYIVLRVQ